MLPLTNCYDETIKMAAINFLSNTANLQSDELKAYQWAEISEGRFDRKFFLRFSCLDDLRGFLKTKERIFSKEFFFEIFSKIIFFKFFKKNIFFEFFDFFLSLSTNIWFSSVIGSKNLQFLVAYWSAFYFTLLRLA